MDTPSTDDPAVLLWVFRQRVESLQGRFGFLEVKRSEAQALIDEGVAMDVAQAIATSTPLVHIEGSEACGYRHV